jgi:uncharacterized cupredoxin-like copper-binding protein
MTRRPLLLAATLALVALLGACSSAAQPAGTTITVTMGDKEIALSQADIAAGAITFNVINSGTIVHSLVLMKTDTPHDQMPLDSSDASKVKETGTIAVTGQMAVGTSKQISRQLAAGKYVLVCNEPAHYAVGMHTGLVVK